ncbi:MAG: Ribulose-phosphate 3-epimerase [Candidatus Woesebacteria bacterium GW2011_GWA2_40_7]|uniref:Ribulose-phosphate 3-epimerase n=3 Tax=Candidatus Woeseibacteriota TaxID=1752722 RepID=A0A0G0X6E3_9BACT|nr:MAG: Ribulose-phosphate 3-epimerase [Candidatus Woesebacteria bacterium GW2011_GWB1_39_10]KKR73992.1 MAG: Ribulose-phosphate 3-epimerase [Candidatus Woesebacteria bacterium GW2011_GWA2_40_7]KKR92220.1 MAG: Ribulose-phosphate 3-epimerase [Candidatus Woesebacteria bacterium GW2011_GWA1_41_13b]
MINIIPAILTNNVTELEEKVKRINDVSYIEGTTVRTIQIDIIDGVFADNRTVDPANLVGLDTDLGLDFHLMVKEPINWIEKCANAGADRIIGQIEMMKNQVEFVGKVQETGLYVGLALDLETPVTELDSLILNNVDVVLLMAVKAGWGGQRFDKRVFDKIKELDEIRSRDKTPFKICVDGGETTDVIDDTHYAGADEVVIGKRLFDGDLAANFKKFIEAAH